MNNDPVKEKKVYHLPNICIVNTDRSSSPCIKLSVRRSTPVTSLLAFMRTSSLQPILNHEGEATLKATDVNFLSVLVFCFSFVAIDPKSSPLCNRLRES